jgi:DNA-binding NarL/FixJ family response regulator
VRDGANAGDLLEVHPADGAVRAAKRPAPRDALAILTHERLSSREQQVCHAMLRGLSDKQIATALDVGIETVKAHTRAAFAKLSVSGRGGLLAKPGA